MNVIITGASGFIGSRLVVAARSRFGQKVTAFSSRGVEGSHIVYKVSEPVFGLGPRELEFIREAEVLVHAGAFTPKSVGDANNRDSSTSNISFTDRLLTLPWANLKKIVFLSSVDVYSASEGPITEESCTIPKTLYGLSKLYGEQLVNLYCSERSIACQVLRIGHVFGPGEEQYQKVIPRAIRNIVLGENLEMWGNGNERRSFIYVDDVISAVLAAVELEEQPGVINVVGGNPIAIRELLHILLNLSETSVKVIRRETNGFPGDLVFDATKMNQYLLNEETDLTIGLKKELEYVKSMFATSP